MDGAPPLFRSTCPDEFVDTGAITVRIPCMAFTTHKRSRAAFILAAMATGCASSVPPSPAAAPTHAAANADQIDAGPSTVRVEGRGINIGALLPWSLPSDGPVDRPIVAATGDWMAVVVRQGDGIYVGAFEPVSLETMPLRRLSGRGRYVSAPCVREEVGGVSITWTETHVRKAVFWRPEGEVHPVEVQRTAPLSGTTFG